KLCIFCCFIKKAAINKTSGSKIHKRNQIPSPPIKMSNMGGSKAIPLHAMAFQDLFQRPIITSTIDAMTKDHNTIPTKKKPTTTRLPVVINLSLYLYPILQNKHLLFIKKDSHIGCLKISVIDSGRIGG